MSLSGSDHSVETWLAACSRGEAGEADYVATIAHTTPGDAESCGCASFVFGREDAYWAVHTLVTSGCDGHFRSCNRRSLYSPAPLLCHGSR